ncbi:hypothetical protein ES703_66166 [subsurface metagenome]
MNLKGFLSRRQVAKKLNVTYRTLQYQEKKGRFKTRPFVSPGGQKTYYYDEDEFRKAQVFYGILDFNYITDAAHVR